MQILVDLPDDMEQEVSFTLTGRALEHQKKVAVAAAMTEANATIKIWQDAAKETDSVNSEQFDRMREYVAQIEQQKSAMAAMEQVNQQQSVKLREAMEVIGEQSRRIALLEGKPPVVVPPAPPVVPVTPIATLPKFATYIVDEASSGAGRTRTIKGHITKLAGEGFKEQVLFCNEDEIADGDIPEFMEAEKVIWWADTWRAVYLNCKRKSIEWNALPANKDKQRNFWKETMGTIVKFKALAGFVLDDVNAISAGEFEEVVSAIRLYSPLPIVATYGAGTDLTPYMATIIKYKVLTARQFFRQELEKAGATIQARTGVITKWLRQPGYVCDIVNLEYFMAGTNVTDAADLEAMYNLVIDEGKKAFMGYAAVDTNGFKVWDNPALWASLKRINAAYPSKVLPLPVKA